MHGHNLIACVLPLMAEHGIKFSTSSSWGAIEKGTIGISSLFANWVKFQPHCQRLRSHGLVALEQMLSPDCKMLLSWRELHCLIPSLTYAVPQWFQAIEAALGVQSDQVHGRDNYSPSPTCPPSGLNPFCDALLSFPPVVASPGSFVAVFPASFADDGGYFLARLINWNRDGEAGPVKYHLQHWCEAELHDDLGLYEAGYYVQCHGDCDMPQVCTSCIRSCCWWESSGVADMSSGVWVGQLHHVNFIGDEVATVEFACVDISQASLEALWQQLPDEVEGVSDIPAAAQARPAIIGLGLSLPTCNQITDGSGQDVYYVAGGDLSPARLEMQEQQLSGGVNSLLDSQPDDTVSAATEGIASTVGGIFQAPPLLVADGSSLVVYSDGSLQGSGSDGCCGGAGIAVLDGDKSLWEVAVCVGGWLSSTKTEIYACIMALVSLPQHYPIQIFTDSQGLMSGFHSFVTQAHLQSFRKLLWTRFYQEWAVLYQIVAQLHCICHIE